MKINIELQNLQKKAVYGLPELGREKIKEAKLVAVPGCYPTASILGIIPVIDFVDNKSEIILDVKSGISGAGRNKVEEGLSSEIKDNFKAYSPEFHRHQTEINYFLKKNYGITQEIIFVRIQIISDAVKKHQCVNMCQLSSSCNI